jgi:hypothetical protein
MLGHNAISEQAIAATATTVSGAGKIVGVAVVAGHIKFIGVFPSAGKIMGQAIVAGVGFTGGNETLGLANQLFDFSVDALSSLLWQDDVDPILTALVEAKQSWYDLNFETFWQNLYTNVFDLRTANWFGCTVWSIILKMPINIQYPETDGANWGFGPYQQNFSRGNFAPLDYEVIPLSVPEARALLQLRYYDLITHGQVPDINKNLARIFAPFGGFWCVDNLDMTMDYVFDFKISSPMEYMINLYNLMPQPVGVQTRLWQNGQSAGNITGAAIVAGATSHVAGHIVGAATVLGVGAQI